VAQKFDPSVNWAKRIELDPASPAYGRPVVDEAVAVEMGEEPAPLPLDLLVGQDHLVDAVVVPLDRRAAGGPKVRSERELGQAHRARPRLAGLWPPGGCPSTSWSVRIISLTPS
jgi:hypothetical protein